MDDAGHGMTATGLANTEPGSTEGDPLLRARGERLCVHEMACHRSMNTPATKALERQEYVSLLDSNHGGTRDCWCLRWRKRRRAERLYGL